MTFSGSPPYPGIGAPSGEPAAHSFSRRDAVCRGTAVLVAATTFAMPFRSFAGDGVTVGNQGLRSGLLISPTGNRR